MSALIISEAAKTDLREIAVYISGDNPERAVSFVDELIAKIQVVSERPHSFAKKDDLHAGMRSASHGHYRIVFRADDAATTILRVLHGARDIRSILAAK